MEEKLELNQVKNYLGTGCKFGFNVEEIHKTAPKEFRVVTLSSDNIALCLDYGKLLLHPSYRLIEPILENGKIPIDELKPNNSFWANDVFDDGKCLNLFSGTTNFVISKQSGVINEYVPFVMVEKLFEWHFDVFGLIEKGLALPIEPK